MGQVPFSRRSASVNLQADRRRSTRLDLAVPIAISGRDASGKTYREETETFSVSFHGAKFKSRQQVLIGMQLTVENLSLGEAEKAICVRVGEAQPGQEKHDIAIQLLRPRNIWGVKNPPADWQVPSGTPAITPEPALIPSGAVPPSGVVAPSSAASQGLGTDQRTSELVESILDLLRRQAAGVLRDALKEFEDQLKTLEAGAEARIIQQSERAVTVTGARIKQQTEKTVEETELALGKLRRDLLEQLSLRTERTLADMEQTLRARIADLFSPFAKVSPPVPTEMRAAADQKK